VSRLGQLDGKEIVIKLYQGGKAGVVRRIPIEIATDIPGQGGPSHPGPEPTSSPAGPVSRTPATGGPEIDNPREPPRPTNDRPPQSTGNATRSSDRGSFWLWVVQISNLVLIVGLAAYALFFALPRVQVLEDRMAKTEMFIVGSREAIREELEFMKREMSQQDRQETRQE
jgi:hypothetical protein